MNEDSIDLDSKRKTSASTYLVALGFILLGSALVFVSEMLEEHSEPMSVDHGSSIDSNGVRKSQSGGGTISVNEAKADAKRSGIEVIRHFGAGIIVAALVAILFHKKEFAEFFEKLASDVLVRLEFLRGFDERRLAMLRKRSAEVHIDKFVTSDKKTYRGDNLLEALTAVEKLLPTQDRSSGGYRRNYREELKVEVVGRDAVEQDLGFVGVRLVNEEYLRVSEKCSYDVVTAHSSRLVFGKEKFVVPFEMSVLPLMFEGAELFERKLEHRGAYLGSALSAEAQESAAVVEETQSSTDESARASTMVNQRNSFENVVVPRASASTAQNSNEASNVRGIEVQAAKRAASAVAAGGDLGVRKESTPGQEPSRQANVGRDETAHPTTLGSAGSGGVQRAKFEAARSLVRQKQVALQDETGEYRQLLYDTTDSGETVYKQKEAIVVEFENGVARVMYSVKSYRRRASEPYIMTLMAAPTHRVTIRGTLAGFNSSVRVRPEIMSLGTAVEPDEPRLMMDIFACTPMGGF